MSSSSWRALQKRYCEQLVQRVVRDPLLRQRRRRTSSCWLGAVRGAPFLSSSRYDHAAVVQSTTPAVRYFSTEQQQQDDDPSSAESFYTKYTNGNMTSSRFDILLGEYYEAKYGRTIIPTDFRQTLVRMEGGACTGWSATFICPVTKVEVPSGTLRKKMVPTEKREATPFKNHDGNDLVVYPTLKMAVSAAAAAMLDRILEAESPNSPRFCMITAPYQSSSIYQTTVPTVSSISTPNNKDQVPKQQKKKLLQTVSFVSTQKPSKDPVSKKKKKKPKGSSQPQNNGSSQPQNNGLTKMGPADYLSRDFPRYYDKKRVTDSCFAVLSVDPNQLQVDSDDDDDEEMEPRPKNPGKVWGAIVTCPVSGTKFPSSVLKYEDTKKTRYWKENDIVYYHRKKVAIRSAVARFVDALDYRKQADGYDESQRWCLEHPSILAKSLLPFNSAATNTKGVVEEDINAQEEEEVVEVEIEKIIERITNVGVGMKKITNDGVGMNVEEDKSMNIRNGVNFEDADVVVDSGSNGVSLTHTEEESSFQDEDVESQVPVSMEDQYYQYIPGIEGTLNANDYEISELFEDIAPPADRLREAACSKFLQQKGSAVVVDKDDVFAEAQAFVTFLEDLVYQNESSSIHSFKVGTGNPRVEEMNAKGILSKIGHSVSITPLGDQAFPGQGARAVANKIINFLWRMEGARPDADTCALFIRCLDDPDIHENIKAASRLIHQMNAKAKVWKTSHSLPQPNTNTMNAFIQVNAQQGGIKGRYAENTSSLEPNRQSFLAVLSSSIYKSTDDTDASGFDPDFVRDCIDRMTELYEETQDVSFRPDTQVYNAPLRWAGGPQLWLASRPYARSINWDNYRNIYVRGVRAKYHNDDLRIQEAEKIRDWIYEMKAKAAKGEPTMPNTETYEALIQAWLRTATRKGLDEANGLIYDLLRQGGDSDVSARLQTLHPVLASWYHSNEPDKWTKISLLIKAWEERMVGEDTLDKRLEELKLQASISTPLGETKNLEEAAATAITATQHLLNMDLTNIPHASNSILVNALRALRAWEDVVGLDKGRLGGSIVGQVEAIYDVVEDAIRKATLSHDTICKYSPLVYAPILSVASQIRERNHSLSPSDAHKISCLISKTIRSFGETRAILKQTKTLGGFAESISSLDNADDGFSYQFRNAIEEANPYSTMEEAFVFLGKQDARNHLCVSDDLCAIYHYLDDFSPESVRLKEEVGRMINQANPGLAERINVLFKMDHDARFHEKQTDEANPGLNGRIMDFFKNEEQEEETQLERKTNPSKQRPDAKGGKRSGRRKKRAVAAS